eukprot:scaffold266896_cov15-Tisochrysis_lutea.AAC.1
MTRATSCNNSSVCAPSTLLQSLRTCEEVCNHVQRMREIPKSKIPCVTEAQSHMHTRQAAYDHWCRWQEMQDGGAVLEKHLQSVR